MSIYTNEQKEIANKIENNSNTSSWRDWKWQVKHTVRDIKTFENLLGIKFTDKDVVGLEKTLQKFPLSITPYYLSLIDKNNYSTDPVFRQSFPSPAELVISQCDHEDPLHEEADSPAPGITHRYPDRVLFHVSNICSMYCRHCTRKRKVGDVDSIPSREEIELGLEYIRQTPVIRDVLLSGGDPLMLPDDYIDWILTELRKIPHIQVIRIGTRMPVVLPYRITDELVEVFKKHHPLWINTHFNHPREITPSAKAALAKLANAGIPLGNQTVLLAGVNDCPLIIKALVQKLVENRVRPYYLYQCDLSEGLSHFRTTVGKGMEIMESLIGHTSGFAVPTYVIDAPGGGGKIPVMPNYLITLATNKVVLRNYEGVITTYQEPDSYEPVFCDRNCTDCKLQLNLEGADDEYEVTGILRLLADHDDTISLTPEDNDRMKRRGNA
ncbi:MAG: lysine 2,3-aminomutase [Geobacteraceae bacterium]|nr:lysine 2,3-aminomutase [Geobacteraceae bacterium]